MPVSSKLALHGIPNRPTYQPWVLARVIDAFMIDLARIKRIGEDFVNMTACKGQIPDGTAPLD